MNIEASVCRDFNAFAHYLNELSSLEDQTDKRLAILLDGAGEQKLGFIAKPDSIFSRLWEWIFGVKDNVNIRNVAQFAHQFFSQNQHFITQENIAQSNDLFMNEKHILIHLKKVLHQQKNPVDIIEQVINQINEVQKTIFQEVQYVVNHKNAIIDKAKQEHQEMIQKAQLVAPGANIAASAKLKQDRKKFEKERTDFEATKLQELEETRNTIALAKKQAEQKIENIQREVKKLEYQKAEIEEENEKIQQLMVTVNQDLEFASILSDKRYQDAVIICKDKKECYLHAAFLLQLDYFKNSTIDEMRKDQHQCQDNVVREKIDLTEIGYCQEAVQLFIQLLYVRSGVMAIPKMHIAELLSLAAYFGTKKIMAACQQSVIERIVDVESALQWLVDDIQYPSIYAHCLDIIGSNIDQFTKYPLFLQLPINTLIDLFKKDRLVLLDEDLELEEFLFKCIEYWLNHQLKQASPLWNANQLETLIRLIRVDSNIAEKYIDSINKMLTSAHQSPIQIDLTTWHMQGKIRNNAGEWDWEAELKGKTPMQVTQKSS